MVGFVQLLSLSEVTRNSSEGSRRLIPKVRGISSPSFLETYRSRGRSCRCISREASLRSVSTWDNTVFVALSQLRECGGRISRHRHFGSHLASSFSSSCSVLKLRTAPITSGSISSFCMRSYSQDQSDREPSVTEEEEDEKDTERRIVDALILTYLASQNGSLFALQCFVETAVVAYRHGYTYTDLKLVLSLHAISAGEMGDPMMIDVLMAWVAVVVTTLRVVGVPLTPDGQRRRSTRPRGVAINREAAPGSEEGPSPSSDGTKEKGGDVAPGLEAFVRGCIERFKSGYDITRLQLQQGMGGTSGTAQAADSEIAGASPSVFVLQQNTRIAILTLQMIVDTALPTEYDLDRVSGSEQLAEDRERHISHGDTESPSESALESSRQAMSTPSYEFGDEKLLTGYGWGLIANVKLPESRSMLARNLAVRLLICFNGAAMGYLRPAQSFAKIGTEAYDAGFTVDDIVDQLRTEEFVQSGGVMGFRLARPPRANQPITLALFSRWLSVVFMALAQLGVVYPGPKDRIGWAWTSHALATTTRWSLDESMTEEVDDHDGGLSAEVRDEPSRSEEERTSNADDTIRTHEDQARGNRMWTSMSIDEDGRAVECPGSDVSAVQVYALSDFVHSALEAAELSDMEDSDDENETNQRSRQETREVEKAVVDGVAAGAVASLPSHYEGFSLTGVEDPKLKETSSFALMMSQMISLVRLTRAHVLLRVVDK